jgi:hydrogenase maturation protein HypF
MAVAALERGEIIAVKGLGGFQLLVDAGNASAVARLRKRKSRAHKPFAVMVPNLAIARVVAQVDGAAEALLLAPQAPIVLLCRQPKAAVAAAVASDNPYLGVMLPYTPLHHLLLADVGRTLVVTSGNRSGEPLCTDEHEALTRLGAIADVFLRSCLEIEIPG